MATQGLVTVINKSGEVIVKFIAGSNGMEAKNLARKLEKEGLPSTLQECYNLAKELGFGDKDDLVVLDENQSIFEGEDTLPDLYRQTFQKPNFNPRWKSGKVENYELVTV